MIHAIAANKPLPVYGKGENVRDWLWVSDLSQPETIALRVLPLATIATQFLLQNMTPSTGMDPQQQRIMKLMPLMFMLLGLLFGRKAFEAPIATMHRAGDHAVKAIDGKVEDKNALNKAP